MYDPSTYYTPVRMSRPFAAGAPAGGDPFVGAFGFAQTTSGSSLTTPSRTTVAGNTVITLASVVATGCAIGTPTDSQTNTYTEDRETATSSAFHLSISHAHNIAGGAGHTVTIGFTAGAFAKINALEYSGMANANPEATNDNGNLGTDETADTGAVTASAGSMCVGMVSHSDVVERVITLTSAGWTQRIEDEDVASGMPMNAADKVSAGASETGTWDVVALGDSAVWLGVIACYTME